MSKLIILIPTFFYLSPVQFSLFFLSLHLLFQSRRLKDLFFFFSLFFYTPHFCSMFPLLFSAYVTFESSLSSLSPLSLIHNFQEFPLFFLSFPLFIIFFHFPLIPFFFHFVLFSFSLPTSLSFNLEHFYNFIIFTMLSHIYFLSLF